MSEGVAGTISIDGKSLPESVKTKVALCVHITALAFLTDESCQRREHSFLSGCHELCFHTRRIRKDEARKRQAAGERKAPKGKA